jgi:hypothetical protein
MTLDAAYSYLMDFAWFFLTGWVLLLLCACLLTFRHDWS